jgi:hypothetical protein
VNAWVNVKLPALTRDIDQLKRDLSEWGYCLLADAVTEDERLRLLERLDEQAALEREQGVAFLGGGGRGGTTWVGYPRDGQPLPAWQGVRTLPNKGRAFIDLAMHPTIRALTAHAFNDAPHYLASMNGLILRNGAIAQAIHVDQLVVPFQTPVPVLNNAMVCLTEFTEANGATRVVPGSHRGPPPKLALNEATMDGYNPEPIESIPAEAPPGAAIIFESRLWHGGAASTSDVVRYSISVAYVQAFMRQQDCYAASLHDDVYASLSREERELVGFKTAGFGRLDPRFPGDRSNTDINNPYVPELRRDGEARAIPVENEYTFGGMRAAR